MALLLSWFIDGVKQKTLHPFSGEGFGTWTTHAVQFTGPAFGETDSPLGAVDNRRKLQ